MAKQHAAIVGKFGPMILCGGRGMRTAGNVNCTNNKTDFAALMASNADLCCEYCAKIMREKFPNTVKNAAR